MNVKYMCELLVRRTYNFCRDEERVFIERRRKGRAVAKCRRGKGGKRLRARATSKICISAVNPFDRRAISRKVIHTGAPIAE